MSDRPRGKSSEDLASDFEAIMASSREAVAKFQAAQGRLLETIERTRASAPPPMPRHPRRTPSAPHASVPPPAPSSESSGR